MDTKIMSFRGEYAFLSNFWSCPVTFEGEVYGSAEAAYQASKTLDQEWRKRIRYADSAKEAKAIGKQVPLRPNWIQIRAAYMRQILDSKFSNPILRQKLKATAPAFLEEANTWGDRYWGTYNGHGANVLGKLLMEIRDGRVVV